MQSRRAPSRSPLPPKEIPKGMQIRKTVQHSKLQSLPRTSHLLVRRNTAKQELSQNRDGCQGNKDISRVQVVHNTWRWLVVVNTLPNLKPPVKHFLKFNRHQS